MTEFNAVIRRVSAQDAGAIADIYNAYVLDSVATFEVEPLSRLEMSRRIEDVSSRYPYLVCEADGAVCGFCYAHQWKDRAAYERTWETTVYVAGASVGRGVGKRLVARLIEECRSAGAHALVACITGGNESSIHMHQGLGFRQVSHFSQVGVKFGRWLDVVDFQLLL